MKQVFSSFVVEKCGHPIRWLSGILLFIALLYAIWSGIQLSINQSLRMVINVFSTQEEVLPQGIFPIFERAWETGTGRDLILEGVSGPSGTLAVQITQGAPADVAIFSNQRHIAGLSLVKPCWLNIEPNLELVLATTIQETGE